MDINLERLQDKIKTNKYKNISNELIKTEINRILKQNPAAKEKEIAKKIKSKLYKIYGEFQTRRKKDREIFIKNPNKILETTLSTKERLPIYSSLYKKIFSITGEPNSILDIGSGMNPASYKFLKVSPKYIAIEIDKEDVEFLNKFFKLNKIKGKAILMEIRESTLNKIPKSDMVFLFKSLDTLEPKKGHKFAEKLVKSLKTKHIVVSFPIRTLSGREMRHPYRGWIERMLSRIGLNFKILKYKNEIFYIIRK